MQGSQDQGELQALDMDRHLVPDPVPDPGREQGQQRVPEPASERDVADVGVQQFQRQPDQARGGPAVVGRVAVVGLERRLGDRLFNDFLALHFSQTRPQSEDGRDHPLIVLVAQEIALAQERGETDSHVNPMNSAVFFLLGLYALLITTNHWPTGHTLLEDYVARNLRSLKP